ncbi:Ubiquinone biosynthesis O-methyltransferase [Enhygromyxa salina]|uniref:Ubiquinone biosynthesis O-methyltransferase n=1 Tax=Enhygromyxa salina TaxID=215803 RepID=A0A2S9YK73_9BACT|nr:class I SAM-dependent methyltransferase [Enhygromyxa salina]PRQ05498.1 Ubiquinone biosynthesis O-methyltransferase [Enhygromyxa salina]
MSSPQLDERSSNQRKHESRNPIQRALIDNFHAKAVELIQRAQPSTILELGCGEGYVLSALADAGVEAELTGVELNARAVRVATERLGERATIEHRDARELAADGRRFDMVMMLEVLEHIPDPEQMLPILDQLSNGWLLLSVPWEPAFRGLNLMRGKNVTRLGNDPDHINHWSRRSFSRFINSRFDIISMPQVFPWTMALARSR